MVFVSVVIMYDNIEVSSQPTGTVNRGQTQKLTCELYHVAMLMAAKAVKMVTV